MRNTISFQYGYYLPNPPLLAIWIEFVFYYFFVPSQNDVEVAEGTILKYLEEDGFRVCRSNRDFTPGLPIVKNITESIAMSRRVILVISR